LAETPVKNGISQLAASTIVKGTKTRSAQQIAESVEHVGGSIGATSGNNSFSVAVEVMRDDLPLGMQILSDVLLNATFPEGEVALEKDSQLAAIKAEDDQITSTARNLLKPRLYGDHPYALRTTGTPESVAKLSSADLKAYRDKIVTGKNGVLSIFGAVNPEEVLALAKKDFGILPSGELALEHPPVSSPLKDSVEASAERQKQQAVIMRGFLGTTVEAADRPVLELIEEASSDLGSRFFIRIREKLGLAYFVGASNSNGLAPGAFVFYLGTDPKKVDLAKREFNDEIDKLSNDGLSQVELDRAKAKLLGAEAIRRAQRLPECVPPTNYSVLASITTRCARPRSKRCPLRTPSALPTNTSETPRALRLSSAHQHPSRQSPFTTLPKSPRSDFSITHYKPYYLKIYGRNPAIHQLRRPHPALHRTCDDECPAGRPLPGSDGASLLREGRGQPRSCQDVHRPP
jgi:zinc protease